MYDRELIMSLSDAEKTKTQVARDYCEKMGLEYNDNVRKRIGEIISADSNLDNVTTTETNQYEKLSPLSALKSDGTIMSIDNYCDHYGIPRGDVRTYKLVTHTGKGAYYNIASNVVEDKGREEEFHRRLIEDISNLPLPKSFERIRESDKESFLLVIDLADLHIGKLANSFETGEEYNSQIAVQRAKEGVEGIVEKTSGFIIDKILFIGGNDILHVDTPKNTTTSGTSLDTDGSWYTNFLIAKQLYIELLERLLLEADVHFVYNPSNHDWVNGFFLADVIQTYFKDVKNISFDCSINHRKYFKYGKNLIGSTHGDGAKTQDLPLLMAHESPDWGSCKHKYVYTHHLHHKVSKDYMGVNVETLRSASGTDGWHHRNGFVHAPKAVEGFLHSKEHGQIARLTHIF